MKIRAKAWVAAASTLAFGALALGAPSHALAAFEFKFESIDTNIFGAYAENITYDGNQDSRSTEFDQGFILQNSGGPVNEPLLSDIDPLLLVSEVNDEGEVFGGTVSLNTTAAYTGIFVRTGGGPNVGEFFDGDTSDGIFTATFSISTPLSVSNIQVVPLPAAAWTMIGGLGVVGGIISRRRRAAAAAAA